MDQFLSDGGIALRHGIVSLPRNIMLTEAAIAGQHLTEYVPGKTLISYPFFGFMFSFLVPMTPEKIIDHFENNALLSLSGFRSGRLMTACTGERFRYIDCSLG